MVAVQQRALERMKEAETVVKGRVGAGLAPPIDENRARLRRVQQVAMLADYAGQERESLSQLAVSLGMTKTLIEAPGLMTHCALDPTEQSAAGIHPGGIRLSLGIENVEDLLKDLEAGLAAA